MSDALRPGEPVEGEYTDSELPLDAELSKDEYAAVEEVVEADDADGDGLVDTEEVDVEIIEIVDDASVPPGRDSAFCELVPARRCRGGAPAPSACARVSERGGADRRQAPSRAASRSRSTAVRASASSDAASVARRSARCSRRRASVGAP